MASVNPGESFQRPVIGDIARQGKTEAKKLTSNARSTLMEQVDSRKSEVAGVIRELADSIDQAAEKPELAPILGPVSGVVRRASSAIENGSAEELLQKGQQQFRANPGVYLAGLFAFGFLAGRIIRD